MNGIERMTRQLNHQSVDRIAVSEEFWGLTVPHWVAEGKMKQGESVIDHFNMDMDTLWTFDYTLHPDEKDIVLEEDEDTRLVLNRNHAKLRTHKKHASTPVRQSISVMKSATRRIGNVLENRSLRQIVAASTSMVTASGKRIARRKAASSAGPACRRLKTCILSRAMKTC